MLTKFEIDWRAIGLDLWLLWRKTLYRHIQFDTVLILLTRFKTLRIRVLEIRDIVSESSDDSLSMILPSFFDLNPSSGCKLSSKKFGRNVKYLNFMTVSQDVPMRS